MRSGFVTAVTVAALAASLTSGQAASAASPASSLNQQAQSAAQLANKANFAKIEVGRLRPTTSSGVVPITPTLAVKVGNPTPALTDGHVTISTSTNGTTVVAQVGGFGVVTKKHANVEFRYSTIMPSGASLVPAADGGLDEKNSTGKVVGHIDAAYAVDSSGAAIPASYGYDKAAKELVVKADTTNAKGAVFIDPSWRCYATAGAYGAVWVLAAAAWLFTDGSVVFVMWALRAWFGLSFGAADAIARACTLH
ncbi:hypothetical protein GCM10023258_39880 [Terrabacter aeriphilus]|uniref:Uncharacterized protein n=1 Tax=Terrabacter aeriphilus TaxID=515662 RepID=A0ABP9JQ41_9MICO